MSSLKGWLGVQWGDDATEALEKLSLSNGQWAAWEGDHDYEIGSNFSGDLKQYGYKCQVSLVRKTGKLEGLQLIFSDCDKKKYAAINAAIQIEFSLDLRKDSEIYNVWGGGEVIRLARNSTESTCILTVAGPKFGRDYVNYLLRNGIQRLIGSMQPR